MRPLPPGASPRTHTSPLINWSADVVFTAARKIGDTPAVLQCRWGRRWKWDQEGDALLRIAKRMCGDHRWCCCFCINGWGCGGGQQPRGLAVFPPPCCRISSTSSCFFQLRPFDLCTALSGFLYPANVWPHQGPASVFLTLPRRLSLVFFFFFFPLREKKMATKQLRG